MAFGDPMVLETRYNWALATNDNFDSLLIGGKFDGAFEVGTTTPDGWSIGLEVGSTRTLPAGTRTGGSGSKIFRSTHTSPGLGDVFAFYQSVNLTGSQRLSSYGHAGRQFTFSIWARNNGTGTMRIQLRLIPTNTLGGASGDSTVTTSYVALTSTWTQYTVSITPAAETTAIISADVWVECTVNGNPILEFDESEFYQTYTFAVNAAMPDEPRLTYPQRTFQRSVANDLIRHRPSSITAARYEYTLHFGLIGLTQVKALRSLWLLDTPMRWQPNLPHLPTYLPVIMTSEFNLRLRSPSVNSNNYSGTITMAEV